MNTIKRQSWLSTGRCPLVFLQADFREVPYQVGWELACTPGMQGEADCFQPARPHSMGSGGLKEEWKNDRWFVPVRFFRGHRVLAMGTAWTVKAATRREEWQSKSATDGPWEARGNAPLVKVGGKIKCDDNWAIHVLPLQGLTRPFTTQKTQVSASFSLQPG